MGFKEDIKGAVEGLYNRSNVMHPTDWELQQMAETYGTFTEFGNVNFSTSVRNRISGVTVYLGSLRVQ